MPALKYLTKDQIVSGMRHTRSIKALARYLRCSFSHLKKFMKLYTDEETGKTLFEIHKNPAGKGIKKHLPNKRKYPVVKIIFKEGTGYESFTPERIKTRGIEEGYLKEECYCCGFNERRIVDYKVPLLMSFKDGNRQNYLLDNVELLCYNCYFLQVGNIFTPDQVRYMEDYTEVKTVPYNWELDYIPKDLKTDWHLSEDQIENMKSLGLWDEQKPKDETGNEFITRKI